eukprot:NODE_3797_length_345_cov_57.486486_g3715_i0.p1 GENE.NODE_3797_length_345_cov_57.486486_g3715_i0~~NODE_3797_length_345_cov_57.486486_g3715_i0.p1  ORF type:complete len:51 (+),score=1.02 NODE_3797_length_345_cov_57.486486_g3715_i0:60-212(+)
MTWSIVDSNSKRKTEMWMPHHCSLLELVALTPILYNTYIPPIFYFTEYCI